MKIAQNRICISDPPEMCEETSTAYYGDILDVFETSRTADCWDACDVVKECAFVNFIISTQSCILLRDVNTTMRTTYKQGSTSRLKGCLSKCCEIQSTLDIVDFSVTRQKSTISSFSTIRNYFWGQRSNIPQIIGKLKEGCAISDIILRVIGCKQS